MKLNLKNIVLGALLPISAAVMTGCSGVSAMTPGKMEWIKTESDAPRAGNAYLIRGFIGFFSAGIDSLEVKIDQAGIRANIFQQDQRLKIAEQLCKTYKGKTNREPLILIGHSLGADDAIMCARELEKVGVEVDMLITLDPTRPPQVPKNVKVVYNYYQPSIWDGTGILRGIALTADPGFKGKLYNMNVRTDYKHLLEWDTNHVNIDKNQKIHADAIQKMLTICPPRDQWVKSRGMVASSTTRPVNAVTAGGDAQTATSAVEKNTP